MKEGLYKVGNFLSSIIVKNITLFISLGVLAILSDFSEFFTAYRDEIFNYIIPLGLGYTTGKSINERYGGAASLLAIGGVLTKYGFENYIGAILIGVFAGGMIEFFERALKKFFRLGTEMLIMNFAVSFIGIGVGTIYYFIEGLISAQLNLYIGGLSGVLNSIYGMIFLGAFTEVSKVFFFNNILNHGIYSVFGFDDVQKFGKSIFYLIETNPGPGFGLLMAFLARRFENRKILKESIFIHIIGGVHEIYFPLVLKYLSLILSLMAGGVVGNLTFYLLNTGLVSTASPGSLLTIIFLAKGDDKVYILLGIGISALVTYIVASLQIKYFLKGGKEDFVEEYSAEISGGEKVSIDKNGNMQTPLKEMESIKIRKIAVVCDAGLGSSAVGANILRRELESRELREIEIVNTFLRDNLENYDLIVTHENFKQSLQKRYPDKSIYLVKDYLRKRNYEELAQFIAAKNNDSDKAILNNETFDEHKNYDKNIVLDEKEFSQKIMEIDPIISMDMKNDVEGEVPILEVPILKDEGIRLGLRKTDKESALRRLGESLVENGYVEEEYIDSMFERETHGSTYLARGVAIPHGTRESQKYIKKSGIVFHQYPYGMDFDGKTVYILIGIAVRSEQHMDILEKIAALAEDKNLLQEFEITDDKNLILKQFGIGG